MQTILPPLRAIIAQNYLQMPAEDLPTDQPLISTGLIDSFSLVDLALEIQTQFGVHIDDTELNAETFDTLEDLAALIQTRS